MNIENVVRSRRRHIKRADLLRGIAEGCLCDHASQRSRTSVHCSAKFYDLAAREYVSAGLGLLAQQCWDEAVANFTLLGKREDADRCFASAAEVPTYWDGGAE
jgi:hypothetical protein